MNRFPVATMWVMVLATASLAPAQPADNGPPPALVRFGEVSRASVQEQRTVIGRVAAVRSSVVAAEEAGRVTQAPPDAGTKVKQGDILAKLDTALLETQRQVVQAQLAEAGAIIDEAKATLDEARARQKRYASLVDSGAVTPAEYDETVRNAQVARARLATADAVLGSRQAELRQIDIRLEKMTIRAPFAGELVGKRTEIGEWLDPGTAVADLLAIDRVDLDLNVPEQLIKAVARDAALNVKVAAANVQRQGKIHRVVSRADPRTRTFPITIRLDNADGKLKPGMTAEAEVPTGRAIETLLVPRDAVQITPTGAQVVVERGGSAAFVNVEVMFNVGTRFAVRAPLKAGERVVVEGNERVRPGQPLQPLTEQASQDNAPAQPAGPDSDTSTPPTDPTAPENI